MTRPVLAYATLIGLGLVGTISPATAQAIPADTSPEGMARIKICTDNASRDLNTPIEVVGLGENKLAVIVPAPPPHTGLSDGCVVWPDGSLTDRRGRLSPNRPPCVAAGVILRCAEDLRPKAGS